MVFKASLWGESIWNWSWILLKVLLHVIIFLDHSFGYTNFDLIWLLKFQNLHEEFQHIGLRCFSDYLAYTQAVNNLPLIHYFCLMGPSSASQILTECNVDIPPAMWMGTITRVMFVIKSASLQGANGSNRILYTEWNYFKSFDFICYSMISNVKKHQHQLIGSLRYLKYCRVHTTNFTRFTYYKTITTAFLSSTFFFLLSSQMSKATITC